MSNSIQTDRSFVKLLALLMVIYSVPRCESHIAELLFEEEDSPAVVASLNRLPLAPATDDLPPMLEDNVCHVEFTVVKRAVGRCVKVGKITRACVSGAFIHPFHPDCL